MAWILFGLGMLFFVAVGWAAGWSRATIGGLILVGGLANTSFLGLPMIATFYGKEHLGLGILIDQLGTYVVLSTLGILVAVTYAAGDASPVAIAKKIAKFPPFQAVLLALRRFQGATPVRGGDHGVHRADSLAVPHAVGGPRSADSAFEVAKPGAVLEGWLQARDTRLVTRSRRAAPN